MPNPREEVERGDLVERRILEEAVASPCFWLFETFVEQIGREPQPTDTVLMLTREECQNILAALSRAEAEREERTTALEALVRAVDGLLLSFAPKVAEAMAEAKRVLALGLSSAPHGKE